MSARLVAWSAMPLAALLLGCAVGHGEGVVVGSLFLPGCEKDQDLKALGRDAFDLRPDYFVAQPVLDTDEDEATTRDALFIRIQHGGAQVDAADTLTIQVLDLDSVQTGGRVEEVMPTGCQRSSGEDGPGDARGCVRATLRMPIRCPDTFESLEAAAYDPTPDQGDNGDETPCPTTITTSPFFEGDFDRFEDSLDPFWSGGAEHPSCIAFRDIGREFGDEIAAVFHFNIRDARTIDGKSSAGGYLRGRFRFKFERGPGAQTFP